MPDPHPDLRPDCGRCAALCCVALDLIKSDRFAIDKPAGTPCPNLAQNGLCAIHQSLDDKGFSGCSAYDCLGAGQRVVQDIFDGKSWQDRPELLPDMMEAFALMRPIHQALELLVAATALPMTPEQASTRHALLTALAPEDGWSMETLRAAAPDLRAVKPFLRSLQNVAKSPQG
ncbi:MULTISPECIES: hypothetical protein [Halocynthiibacter]|uniref:Pentapeptide repeat-containing protein n=1 Tax=Halocynthiibacter halioticoli TaxID=2986804 RepID=A0AAE3LQ68_9RHOB|nr:MULTISPECIES: hypothetical protein [Halocynthiibacter]MCV6824157.1 hypothetical protein [Halocynthiibacter halioticoli]MCW4057158.1 hypothetical protein [Halocynthiibacter sp. SDUM655004]